MTRYTILKLNPLLNAWTVYDSTYCQVDATAIAKALQDMGFQADITTSQDCTI